MGDYFRQIATNVDRYSAIAPSSIFRRYSGSESGKVHSVRAQCIAPLPRRARCTLCKGKLYFTGLGNAITCGIINAALGLVGFAKPR